MHAPDRPEVLRGIDMPPVNRIDVSDVLPPGFYTGWNAGCRMGFAPDRKLRLSTVRAIGARRVHRRQAGTRFPIPGTFTRARVRAILTPAGKPAVGDRLPGGSR